VAERAGKVKKNNLLIILILGALSTVTPFSIDLYLPAFPELAQALNTTSAKIALSLSSYFIGLSIGQLFYGPLLDRFGRKKPLAVGLVLYLLTTFGCLFAGNVEALIGLRFLQALGGCVASVASVAMVRDFFPVKEGAKIFSLLMLILGVSPLFAPTVGGMITTAFGWPAIFIALLIVVGFIFFVTMLFLPAGRAPDESVSLKAKPILLGFWEILRHPQFYTYTFSSALSFAGLFTYVAGSPIIFMNVFHTSARFYGGIFAFLSVGFIGTSQVNIWLNKKFSSEYLFKVGLNLQVLAGTVFFLGAYFSILNLYTTIFLIFLQLSCLGLTNPNGSALALAPFSKNAGRASALLGFLQMGAGALASTGVGLLNAQTLLSIVCILVGCSMLGWIVLRFGRGKIGILDEGADEPVSVIH
jgi:DHA1 family bicyclomycin/chloramphenicol resistance-like MFS transporter